MCNPSLGATSISSRSREEARCPARSSCCSAARALDAGESDREGQGALHQPEQERSRLYAYVSIYIDAASRGRARGRCRERKLNDSPRAKASAGYAIKAQREVGDRLSFPSGGGNPKTKPLLALPLSAHSTPTPCSIDPLPAAYDPHMRVQILDRDLPDHAQTRACKGVQVGHFSVPAVSSAARGLPRGIRTCTRRVDGSGGLIVSPVHGALGERVF
ncbi:hypothetical protein C8R44DRAFT_863001 [Mycena epipterygia]|nr:hypothetical protein C8R44DRAFT_863001 [Mycena epipterygia]